MSDCFLSLVINLSNVLGDKTHPRGEKNQTAKLKNKIKNALYDMFFIFHTNHLSFISKMTKLSLVSRICQKNCVQIHFSLTCMIDLTKTVFM